MKTTWTVKKFGEMWACVWYPAGQVEGEHKLFKTIAGAMIYGDRFFGKDRYFITNE